MKVKGKLLFFIFLIDSTDNSSFTILTATMYWLCICCTFLGTITGDEAHDGSDTGTIWRMVCYYKGLILPGKL